RSPNASRARAAVPKRLVTSGKSAPSTLRKSRAGPPAAMTRRWISATSSRADTGAVTSTRSPSRRRRASRERRSGSVADTGSAAVSVGEGKRGAQFALQPIGDPVAVPPLDRADRQPLQQKAEVEVIAPRQTGRAAAPEARAAPHLVPFGYVDRRQVRVERHQPVAVIDHHGVAVDPEVAR